MNAPRRPILNGPTEYKIVTFSSFAIIADSETKITAVDRQVKNKIQNIKSNEVAFQENANGKRDTQSPFLLV